MNTLMTSLAESEPVISYSTIETTALEDLYSTTPLKIIGSLYQQPNEDELHSSFEEAISDRVCALNERRKYLSVPLIEDAPVQPEIGAAWKLDSRPTGFALLSAGSRQLMLRLAIACMLIMVGFDLMGLLVLFKI